MTEWKDVLGFKGQYRISNTGLIQSLKYDKTRILKFDLCKGYYRVTLSKNNKTFRFLVSRLVAIHFIDRITGKEFVNHIDGNKKNNHYLNLEWVTRSENEKHSYTHLNKIPPCAKSVINTKTGERFTSISKAAISIGMKATTLLAKMSGQNFNDTSISYAT